MVTIPRRGKNGVNSSVLWFGPHAPNLKRFDGNSDSYDAIHECALKVPSDGLAEPALGLGRIRETPLTKQRVAS